MYNNNLTVELVTENKNKITEFNHEGRTYVEGRKGSKYKIKVTNGHYGRIKIITSVDGLDILTGKRALANGGGYVLKAYETLILDGWRISDQQVREFFFTNEKNSYNAKTSNDTNNLGVVGVIAYKEYVKAAYPPSINPFSYYINNGHYDNPMNGYYGMTYNSAQVMNAPYSTRGLAKGITMNSVGTGMGETKESTVQYTSGVWEALPSAKVELYYKSRKELEAMGIQVATIKSKPMPSAFGGYCQEV